jgi:hypothetical protein
MIKTPGGILKTANNTTAGLPLPSTAGALSLHKTEVVPDIPINPMYENTPLQVRKQKSIVNSNRSVLAKAAE